MLERYVASPGVERFQTSFKHSSRGDLLTTRAWAHLECTTISTSSQNNVFYCSQFNADSNICVQGLTYSLQPSSCMSEGVPFLLVPNSPSKILFCISNQWSASSSIKGLSPIMSFVKWLSINGTTPLLTHFISMRPFLLRARISYQYVQFVLYRSKIIDDKKTPDT